jgi:hypothetical protein
MRIRLARPLFGPVLLALALTACGGADEDLAGEALSADEVSGVDTAADFTIPRPGQYTTTQELIDVSMPSLPPETLALMRREFAAGASVPHSYCVNEQMTREEWLSQMAESNCTVSRSTPGAGGIDMVLSCTGTEGMAGRIALKGTATAEGSDIEMTFTQPIPNVGDTTIKMRVKSQRTGDCA